MEKTAPHLKKVSQKRSKIDLGVKFENFGKTKQDAYGIEKYLKCNMKNESCASWVELCKLGRVVQVASSYASWVELCELGRVVRVRSSCAS